MKKLSMLTLIFAAQLSYAVGLPIVEKVEKTSFIDYGDCAYCLGGSVIQKTTFTISLSSCRTYKNGDFSINIKKMPDGLSGLSLNSVSIDFKQPMMDCMGPTRRNTYKVSTQEIKKNGNYVLTNPSRL